MNMGMAALEYAEKMLRTSEENARKVATERDAPLPVPRPGETSPAGGRADERRIKQTHHRERWCPFCTSAPHTSPPQVKL